MRSVLSYYRSSESRLGYRYVLQGIRHFGYYETPTGISHNQAQEAMMRVVGDRLALAPGAVVLDAGCGEGATAVYLAQQYGFAIQGIDLLPESISLAQSRATAGDTTVDFTVASFTKLPFADGTFEGIYALESFIHATDPLAVLREFKRVLKPNGKLVIADYTCADPDTVPEKYQRVGQWAVQGTASPGLAIIRHDYYQSQLPGIGFTNVEVTDITNNIMPMLRWFRKLAFLPYQVVRLIGKQVKFANTTMGYYGQTVARKGWWRFVMVSAERD